MFYRLSVTYLREVSFYSASLNQLTVFTTDWHSQKRSHSLMKSFIYSGSLENYKEYEPKSQTEIDTISALPYLCALGQHT